MMIYLDISEPYAQIQFEFETCLGSISTTLHEQLQSPALEQIVRKKIRQLTTDNSIQLALRLESEYFGQGPLEELIADTEITEILVNDHTQIWYEKAGKLHCHYDRFVSAHSLRNWIHQLQKNLEGELTKQTPFLNGKWNGFRVHVVDGSITSKDPHVSLRRLGGHQWNLEKLTAMQWCTPSQADFLRQIVDSHKNILVIGSTGSGKTSVINSLLQLCDKSERCVIVEDTDEIQTPNQSSVKMLTRSGQSGIYSDIDLTELVRQTLRMRPDRLVVGEIRGGEAKDFLLALSTGHAGSFCTLHANSAQEALMRLEMLIQMGAAQWSLQTVRRLLQMSLHYIVQVGRAPSGERKLIGVHKISSLEDFGFLLDREA